MFDTHAHLSDKKIFVDLENVLIRAHNNGITNILSVCSDAVEVPAFESLIRDYNFIYGAIGIHPHNANQWNGPVRQQLCRFLEQDKIVALGEIGLDYHYNFSPQKVQQETFRQQLQIALDKKLPVIIHSREAMNDTLKILRDLKNVCGVMHCFSGTVEEMQFCIELGLYVSLSGTVTFSKADTAQLVATKIPDERLLIETDCPYLTPHPYRGKINEPSFIKYTFEKIAELREIPVETLIKTTTNNAMKLFKIF